MSISDEPIPHATSPKDESLSAAISKLAVAIETTGKYSKNPAPVWNSLEVWKLIISAITPLLVLGLGISIAHNQHRLEILATSRLKSYDLMKDDLNRIHCFILDVGTWKEETPEKVIGYKRAVDRVMFEDRGIWSEKTFAAYVDYMNAAFETYQGPGEDAHIRTSYVEKEYIPKWQKEWNNDLTGSIAPSYNAAFGKLYDSFLSDITQ